MSRLLRGYARNDEGVDEEKDGERGKRDEEKALRGLTGRGEWGMMGVFLGEADHFDSVVCDFWVLGGCRAGGTIGRWCNGSTKDFDSFCGGSNPPWPTMMN